MSLLGDERFGRALEIGCSVGVFTELLSRRCNELVAVDASALAARRARRRLAGVDHVTVERRTIPEQMPPGHFDLIVCSEVLYYFNEPRLLALLDVLERALRPGGVMLTVHGRFSSRTCPLTGDQTHAALRGNTTLHNVRSETRPKYRMDRFDKRSAAVPRQRGGPAATRVDRVNG